MTTISENHYPKRNRMLLSETKSVCPVCLKRLDAQYVAEENRVFLEKICPEHGTFSVPVWDNPISFFKWKARVAQEPEFIGDCPKDCGLCENHLPRNLLCFT